jgi:hypothetical protein
MTTRQKLIWLVGAAVLMIGLTLAVALSSGGDGSDGDSFEGVLVAVEPDHLSLRLDEPADGKEVIDFIVRPADRARLGLSHLRVHLRDSLPVVVLSERVGDDYVARDVLDAPF